MKKNAEDRIVDAVCLTARAGWRATKFIAPRAGSIVWKIATRAGKAAAETNAGQTTIETGKVLCEPAATKQGVARMIIRGLMGW